MIDAKVHPGDRLSVLLPKQQSGRSRGFLYDSGELGNPLPGKRLCSGFRGQVLAVGIVENRLQGVADAENLRLALFWCDLAEVFAAINGATGADHVVRRPEYTARRPLSGSVTNVTRRWPSYSGCENRFMTSLPCRAVGLATALLPDIQAWIIFRLADKHISSATERA